MEEKPCEGHRGEPLLSPPPPSPPDVAAVEPLDALRGDEEPTGGGGGDAARGDGEPTGGGSGDAPRGDGEPTGGADERPSTPPPSDASPTDGEIHLEQLGEIEEPANGESDPPPVATPGALSEELREKIVRQVEYYFSDENLPTDTFLLKHIKKNKGGFVPISLIASFRKMKKLVQDNSLVESALRTSSKLVMSTDGKKIKRLHPLTSNTDEEAKLRTVLVKNLPANCSEDYIRNNFGSIGKIKRISIQGHALTGNGVEMNRERTLISRKLHAYVEYETAEAARDAVASLNDKSDWRSGLRVEPVLKQVVKQGLKASKGLKESISDKYNANNSPNPVNESDGKPVEQPAVLVEQEDQLSSQEKNELKHQGRRRGRAQQQYHVEGLGRGNVNGARIEGLNRPVLGPRMPDGTRGFTMGRGKPVLRDQIAKEDA